MQLLLCPNEVVSALEVELRLYPMAYVEEVEPVVEVGPLKVEVGPVTEELRPMAWGD